MPKNSLTKNRMSMEDHARVSEAVGLAEQGTAGEIVTIVTQRSDTYADVALWWSAFASFLALGALAVFPDFTLGIASDLLGAGWVEFTGGEIFEIALIFVSLTFLGTRLLLQWMSLRLWMTPRVIKQKRARGRAIRYFKVGAERRTAGRTGILLYVSIDEHVAEIVADEAIHASVPQQRWGQAMARLVGEAREGQLGAGMVAAIGDVGAILTEHFPRAANDINELPDRLIEL